MTNAADFAKGMSQGMGTGPDAQVAHDLFKSMSNIKVGEPVVTGNKASVPDSCTVMVMKMSKNFAGKVNLIKDSDGIWKWDLSGSDDLQTESANQTKALLGNPTN
jgi:hypothetical protein